MLLVMPMVVDEGVFDLEAGAETGVELEVVGGVEDLTTFELDDDWAEKGMLD